jgi:coenzyme Q-binding protein COQ10
MPSFTQTKTLPYPAASMQQLVLDIEKYSEFLPWCRQAKIVRRVSSQNLQADLLINFKNFFEKYRSDVRYGKTSETVYFIDVAAIEGPFKKLTNRWKFRDLGNGNCEVEFFIDFEFNSIFLTKMLGAVFEKAAEKMMNCFEERAEKIVK